MHSSERGLRSTHGVTKRAQGLNTGKPQSIQHLLPLLTT